MLLNRFQDSLYCMTAQDVLGLSLYSSEDILTTSFFSDVKEGDLFLQYRRPSFSFPTRMKSSPSPFSGAECNSLPSIITHNNLTNPKIGFLNPHAETTHPGFRILQIFSVDSVNDKCTRCQAFSVYSNPNHWAFRQVASDYYSGPSPLSWRDLYVSYLAETRDLVLRKGGEEESRGRVGLIGKFTEPEKLLKHFYASEMDTIRSATLPPALSSSSFMCYEPRNSFYALWRALVSDETFRPTVVASLNSYIRGDDQ